MDKISEMIKCLLFFTTLLLSRITFAQFQVNGNATNIGGNTYKLTDPVNNQFGAVWYKLQHNLTTSLNVQGQMYFGTDPGGADGICFVLQNNCLSAGTAGGGIGYANMPGQSIGVEFDTYENSPSTGAFDNHDPTYDHIAISRAGSVDHSSVNNLAGPIQMDAVKADVEDGLWYDFRIHYDPATFTLSVYFNGVLRLSYVYDLRSNIFGGDPYVYWGFTSATGGFNNEHRVNINAALTTYTLENETICTGPLQVHLPPLTNFAQQNIALNKPSAISSSEYGNTSTTEANDGNMGSRWSSQFSDPQWIYIDLLSIHDIDSVVLYWEGAYGREYKIQTSNDGLIWTDRFHEINGNGGKDFIPISIPNIRYIRMYGIQRATPYGYSLYEFQIYGKPKYVWSPNDGSINDIYSSDPIFNPSSTTTYTVIIPDPCTGAVSYNMTITIDCTTMPVELLEFDGVVKNNIVELHWTTTYELNSDYFEVLRSFDGVNFTSIGKVKALGNSNTNHTYYFDDTYNYEGSAYYQLKEVDIDSKTQNSPIIIINKNSSAKPIISQPVFENETLLELPREIEYIKYTLIDILGRTVYYQEINSTMQTIPIGGNLIPGSYIVWVETNLSLESIKINKIK